MAATSLHRVVARGRCCRRAGRRHRGRTRTRRRRRTLFARHQRTQWTVDRFGCQGFETGCGTEIFGAPNSLTRDWTLEAIASAAVFNDLAALLRTTPGFAGPGDITVQHAGGSEPGDIPETFYRINSQVNGITVLGGEMILATDGNGAVTGVFIYRDGRMNSVNTTPDPQVDDAADVIALAPRLVWRVVIDPD